MTYVDGYVLPVPEKNIEKYREMAEHAADLWIRHGALDYKECVGDDLADKGFCATFPATINPKAGETIIFAFITFKSREHRDEVNDRVHNDPTLGEGCDPENMPFDCKRMIYGGFRTIVEKSA